MKVVDKSNIIFITKPRININFNCVFCSAKYKTTDINIIHKCNKCHKQNIIKSYDYSLNAISYYLTIAHSKLQNDDRIILRATDSYEVLLQSLVANLTSVGLRVVKRQRIEDINKKTGKDITVNEVILEKLGAIK